jgi:hypothetical protein
MGIIRAGMLAGAAGATALNAVTYLDMSLTGRPASDTPQRGVRQLAERAGLAIPGDPDAQANRLNGMGPLLGIGTALGLGVVAAALHRLGLRRPAWLAAATYGGLAMLASNAPMTKLEITDPKQWTAADWARDAIPHFAYGLAVQATLSLGSKQNRKDQP